MKKNSLEEIIIALSLSNLLFIRSWRDLLYPSAASYHIKTNPYPSDYLGVLLSVLIAAGIIYGGLWLFRKINKGTTPIIAKLFYAGLFVLTTNGVRQQFFDKDLGIYAKSIILFLIIICLAIWQDKFLKATRVVLIFLFPFTLFTFSQSILVILTDKPDAEPTIAEQLSSIQPKDKPEIKKRVVWIIFDELDYFVPFGMNPSKVDLPEFTRLKNESLFATNAVSPSYYTLVSIPALLTGDLVAEAVPSGKNELKLKFKNNKNANFSETSNIFREVKNLGGETAVNGYYHSYCRVIGKDISACTWQGGNAKKDFYPQPLSLHKVIFKSFHQAIISIPHGIHLFKMIELEDESQSQQFDAYVKRHHQIINESKAILSDSKIDLTFIHLPFPHHPMFFDRAKQDFVLPETGYLDNLALSDKVLGELRQTLESKGLWDSSTIIVSSDHQWRASQDFNIPHADRKNHKDYAITNGEEHPNIPFFLKLKGQNKPLVYEKSFNTVITHDLILAIMKGRISTLEEVKEWLDENS